MSFAAAYWWTMLMLGVPALAMLCVYGFTNKGSMHRHSWTTAAFGWVVFAVAMACFFCDSTVRYVKNDEKGYVERKVIKPGMWIPPVQLMVIAHEAYWSLIPEADHD